MKIFDLKWGFSQNTGEEERLKKEIQDQTACSVEFSLDLHFSTFLAPLAVGQRAYVMVRCPSCVRPSVRLCVNFFFKHLLC